MPAFSRPANLSSHQPRCPRQLKAASAHTSHQHRCKRHYQQSSCQRRLSPSFLHNIRKVWKRSPECSLNGSSPVLPLPLLANTLLHHVNNCSQHCCSSSCPWLALATDVERGQRPQTPHARVLCGQVLPVPDNTGKNSCLHCNNCFELLAVLAGRTSVSVCWVSKEQGHNRQEL